MAQFRTPDLFFLSRDKLFAMAQTSIQDLLILACLMTGTLVYMTQGVYWGREVDHYAAFNAAYLASLVTTKKNLLETMEESKKSCVVFYGSQTGTAADYASRLAKEGKSRFGLETMVASLGEYTYEDLDKFPEDKIAIFVLATYGEGDATDDAADFYEFITNKGVTFSKHAADRPLANLKFVVFGLGNKTYEHYNYISKTVSQVLEKLGAMRIGALGLGDDAAGTTEEDFLAWKDSMWAALAETMGLQEREAVYQPVFEITEMESLTTKSPEVYLGEPNFKHLAATFQGPYNLKNPFIAPIVESKELFTLKDRNCLHMEIDISASNLDYQTGDHIAVRPTNSGKEVDRFLDVTGFLSKRDRVISIKSVDPTAKVSLPTPTTYDAVIRYHLEICAPVSRQFVANLAFFAPTKQTKAEMTKLGGDKDYFYKKIGSKYFNIAQTLQEVGGQEKWTSIPFSAFIEGLKELQPRYYSISSSSLVQKKKISITAIVESIQIPGQVDALKGVTTNYLLALKQKQHSDLNPDPHGLAYEITGPRNKYNGIRIPVSIRHSTFRLPSDLSIPIIMVGPGSGVAPFRGFVQERAAQANAGEKVGETILFFGCRKQTEDFLYKSEWEEYKKDLGDSFTLVTAFSRETRKKVYVQHRLMEQAHEINNLLVRKAYFYVCGDAGVMAREVNSVLIKIISEQRGIPESKAEGIVKNMRSTNQYQEDVWS